MTICQQRSCRQAPLLIALLLCVLATGRACWYPYDELDCFIAIQGDKDNCDSSFDFLSSFVQGVRSCRL